MTADSYPFYFVCVCDRAFGQGALPALRVLNLNFNKLSDRALEEMIEALKVSSVSKQSSSSMPLWYVGADWLTGD